MSATGRPRPLVALARAQAEISWNRSRRESGAGGIAAAAMVIVIALFALLPPVLGSTLVGHALAHALAEPGDEEARIGVASFHAFLVWFFGIIGFAGAGRPRFTDPIFRIYPIPRRTLILAELGASALDFVPLLGVGCFAGFLAGMAIARPGFALLAAPVVLGGMVSLLLVHQACGAVQRILLKRPRAALIALGLIGLGLGLLVRVAPGTGTLALGRQALAGFVALQPSGPAWALVDDLADGISPAAPQAALLFPLGIALAALLVLRLLVLESDLVPAAIGGPPAPGGERLWSFGRPAVGVARLFVLQVLAEGRGRFLLVAPALSAASVVLSLRFLPGMLAEPQPVAPWLDRLGQFPLVAWFPALAFALSADLWSNQFGADGHGVKMLFGLPLAMREILLGKMLGMAAFAAAQIALAVPPLALLGWPRPLDLVHGLGCGAAAVLFLGAAGHLLSARLPHRSAGPQGDSLGTPLARLLAPAVSVVALLQLLLLALGLGRALHPGGAPLAMLCLALVLGLGYRAALPWLAGRVLGEQERLLAELG